MHDGETVTMPKRNLVPVPEWLRIRRAVRWGSPDAWDCFAILWGEVAWGMFLHSGWTTPVDNRCTRVVADHRV